MSGKGGCFTVCLLLDIFYMISYWIYGDNRYEIIGFVGFGIFALIVVGLVIANIALIVNFFVRKFSTKEEKAESNIEMEQEENQEQQV